MKEKRAEDFGIRSALLDEICQIAKDCDIKKVFLFGSRARGDFHRASDIDLAVEGGDIINFALDVEEKTQTLLEYDIVDLNRTLSKDLAEAIEKEGVLIYEKV